MTIANLDIWALTGTSTTPPPAKFTLGWTLGEQPPYEYENHLHKETRQKINAMLAELNGVAHPTEHQDFSLPIEPHNLHFFRIAPELDSNTHQSNKPYPESMVLEDICRKSYYTQSMNCHMNSPANEIDLGGGEYIKSIEIGLKTNSIGVTARMILFLCANDNSVHIYDPNTMQFVDDSGLLTGLPSGSGEVWVAESMCSDGYHVFVTFKDTNLTPNETHIIQAYQISDWTIKAGWPATGTLLPGTGMQPNFPTDNPANCCIADGGHLATLNHWTNITGAASPGISIIDRSNGNLVASGIGDSGGGYPFSSICSDGTFVYFGVENGAANGQLASAKISNLAIGCGGTGYPLVLTGSICWDCIYDGEIIASTWKGTSASLIQLSTVALANVKQFIFTGTRYVNYEATYIIFDGLYYYIAVTDPSINRANEIVKLNPAGMYSSYRAFLDDHILSAFIVEPTAIGWQTVGRLATDGRDVFHVLEHKVGTFDGKVRRVFKATAR